MIEDLKDMGIRTWRRRAQVRKEWGFIPSRAMIPERERKIEIEKVETLLVPNLSMYVGLGCLEIFTFSIRERLVLRRVHNIEADIRNSMEFTTLNKT